MLRARLDQWFERHACHPQVAGEFEDSALLKTFGASGMGVFPAATLVEADLTDRHGRERLAYFDCVADTPFSMKPPNKMGHPHGRGGRPGWGFRLSG